MPVARRAVADSQGLAPQLRSILNTVSTHIFWPSKPHLKIGELCKTSVARTGPLRRKGMTRSGRRGPNYRTPTAFARHLVAPFQVTSANPDFRNTPESRHQVADAEFFGMRGRYSPAA